MARMNTLMLTTALLTGAEAAAEGAPRVVKWDGSSLTLTLDGEGAVLTFVNRVSFSPALFGAMTGVVADGGLAVGYRIEAGDGRIPDRLIVLPPDGFEAVPPEVVVEDDDTAVILIVPMLMG